MQQKDDIRKEWYARLEQHHDDRAQKRIVRISDVEVTPDVALRPPLYSDDVSPRPTKLVLSDLLWCEIQRRSGPFDSEFDFMRQTYRGCDIELVRPEDIEAPGWKVE